MAATKSPRARSTNLTSSEPTPYGGADKIAMIVEVAIHTGWARDVRPAPSMRPSRRTAARSSRSGSPEPDTRMPPSMKDMTSTRKLDRSEAMAFGGLSVPATLSGSAGVTSACALPRVEAGVLGIVRCTSARLSSRCGCRSLGTAFARLFDPDPGAPASSSWRVRRPPCPLRSGCLNPSRSLTAGGGFGIVQTDEQHGGARYGGQGNVELAAHPLGPSRRDRTEHHERGRLPDRGRYVFRKRVAGQQFPGVDPRPDSVLAGQQVEDCRHHRLVRRRVAEEERLLRPDHRLAPAPLVLDGAAQESTQVHQPGRVVATAFEPDVRRDRAGEERDEAGARSVYRCPGKVVRAGDARPSPRTVSSRCCRRRGCRPMPPVAREGRTRRSRARRRTPAAASH